MPKATDEQRRNFGDALREAMSHANGQDRSDEWLAEQVGLSPQAIRNYLAGIREPSRNVVAKIEDAVGVQRHELGRHLGIGPDITQQVVDLRAEVGQLRAELARVVRLLESVAPPPT
jgi:ribosome-binding protein aMBF1 (putative translation factor)